VARPGIGKKFSNILGPTSAEDEPGGLAAETGLDGTPGIAGAARTRVTDAGLTRATEPCVRAAASSATSADTRSSTAPTSSPEAAGAGTQKDGTIAGMRDETTEETTDAGLPLARRDVLFAAAPRPARREGAGPAPQEDSDEEEE